MNEQDIKRAIIEARRFIEAANKHLKEDKTQWGLSAGKNSGALRRSSMDLTRSLAAMRGRSR